MWQEQKCYAWMHQFILNQNILLLNRYSVIYLFCCFCVFFRLTHHGFKLFLTFLMSWSASPRWKMDQFVPTPLQLRIGSVASVELLCPVWEAEVTMNSVLVINRLVIIDIEWCICFAFHNKSCISVWCIYCR